MVSLTLALPATGLIRAAEMLTTFPVSGTAQSTAAPDPGGALVVAADGNFYGDYDDGTGFQLTLAGALTVLPRVTVTPGKTPTGLAPAPDGNSYGLTPDGSAAGGTNVIRLAPAGTLTTVCSFDDNIPVDSAAAVIQGTDGNYYGTTSVGGDKNLGSIFRLTPAGVLTTLHSFNGSDGKYVRAGVIQAADGNFYGVAESGGDSNDGTVYRLTPDGTFTVLHSFSGTDGIAPSASLLQATDGNLYGTTANGGTGRAGQQGGTVFRMTPDGTLTTLHSFTYEVDGSGSTGALIEGGDGNFYGTTSQGGSDLDNSVNDYSEGTVFQITPDGTLTTLRAFDRLDGGSPNAALVRTDDGTIYGTTTGVGRDEGGALVNGSIFRLSAVDPATVPTLTAAVAFSTAAANDGNFIPSYGGIVLTLSSPVTRAIKVKYTVSGSAVPGVDYEALSGKVKFKPGQTGAVINVVANFGAGRSSARNIRIKLRPGGTYDLTPPGPLKIKVSPSD